MDGYVSWVYTKDEAKYFRGCIVDAIGKSFYLPKELFIDGYVSWVYK